MTFWVKNSLFNERSKYFLPIIKKIKTWFDSRTWRREKTCNGHSWEQHHCNSAFAKGSKVQDSDTSVCLALFAFSVCVSFSEIIKDMELSGPIWPWEKESVSGDYLPRLQMSESPLRGTLLWRRAADGARLWHEGDAAPFPPAVHWNPVTAVLELHMGPWGRSEGVVCIASVQYRRNV